MISTFFCICAWPCFSGMLLRQAEARQALQLVYAVPAQGFLAAGNEILWTARKPIKLFVRAKGAGFALQGRWLGFYCGNLQGHPNPICCEGTISGFPWCIQSCLGGGS